MRPGFLLAGARHADELRVRAHLVERPRAAVGHGAPEAGDALAEALGDAPPVGDEALDALGGHGLDALPVLVLEGRLLPERLALALAPADRCVERRHAAVVLVLLAVA